ncbi:ureidoglycolate lyase [Shewanella psychropiezotolerans]|uniref:Ureidoglycolate lyase n=1 Tax=Shewanella psychropiezotolerans TaxID=2593655 RepID=A0ABX5X502_9GAMM|nr:MULTISPECIES: ureidoglycolate lyase [Shewanella]MPY24071.1 ureidoglycolate lyase [Shewanella sp. YLB-07]QDO84336.1 ureidoglycolate lyase [Shewanella psychropiezotolerans]
MENSITDKLRIITAKPLTREAFSAFGDVIEASTEAKNFAINGGLTHRYHDLAKIDVNDNDGHTLISIFRSNPLEQPIAIKMMERHPHGSQAFIPLGNNPFLVVVAPAGEFNINNIEVFIASSSQGVNYHKGTWHHFCLTLNSESDFLVIDRGGEGDNCDALELDGSLLIVQE